MSSLRSFKRPYLVALGGRFPNFCSPPVASGWKCWFLDPVLTILITGPCPKLTESEFPEIESGNLLFWNKPRSRLGNLKSDTNFRAPSDLTPPLGPAPRPPPLGPAPSPCSLARPCGTLPVMPRAWPPRLPSNARSGPRAAGVRLGNGSGGGPAALAGASGVLGFRERPGRGHRGGDDGGPQLYGASPDDFPTCLIS